MKNTRKCIAICLAFVMLITQMPKTSFASEKKQIKFSQAKVVLKKGTTKQLKISFSTKKMNQSLKWHSSNSKIVTVSKNGKVKAKKTGKVTITAKTKDAKATCNVYVGTPVKAIKTVKSITVYTNSKVAINALVSPSNATVKKLQYTIGNSKIASVSKNGIVKGIKAGSTKVKIKTTDGTGISKSVTVKVVQKKTTATTKPSSVTNEPQKSPAQDVADETEKVTTAPEPSVVPTTSSEPESTVVPSSAIGNNTISNNTSSNNTSSNNTAVDNSSTTVKSEKITASTNDEIKEALKKSSLKTLELKTDENVKLTIPTGNYKNVDLIVDMPNGEVENNAVFKSVVINSIAQDTFYENAKGNKLEIKAPNSHIVISNAAEATLTIGSTAQNTVIDNDGKVKDLDVQSEGNVTIQGQSKDTITTKITTNVKIETNQRLDVTAIKKFDMTINPGAENSTVTVRVEAEIPNIFGVGVIPITITATGQIDHVVCENTTSESDVSGIENVSFTGKIVDTSSVALSGVQVYMVPYHANYDVVSIASDSAAIKLTTNAEGIYTSNAVKTGNYILVAKQDGYLDVQQTVNINSIYGDTYANETITMIQKKPVELPGSVSGTIIDSLSGDKVPNMTIQIRENKNNISGPSLLETKTDAEGYYEFNKLKAGFYTIQVVDMRSSVAQNDRYMSTSFNVFVESGVASENQGTGISKAVKMDQIRFILTWGNEESGASRDLDSHLIGPSCESGKIFHTFFSDKTYSYNGEKYADLDLDDMEYEGPETTTIYKQNSGVYHFVVRDYSNMNRVESQQLSKSNAKVEVYAGNTKLATYYVPNKKGNVWNVCDYNSDDKTLQNINTVEDYVDEDEKYVGVHTSEASAAFIKQMILNVKNAVRKTTVNRAGYSEESYNSIQDEIKKYQERYDELDKTSDGNYEAFKTLENEVKAWASVILNEFDVKITGDDVKSYEMIETRGTLEIIMKDMSGSYNLDFGQSRNNQVKEVENKIAKVQKTYEITAPSGHVRQYAIKISADLSDLKVKNIVVDGKEIYYQEATYRYTDSDGVNSRIPAIYIYDDIELDASYFELNSTLPTVEISEEKLNADTTLPTLVSKTNDSEKKWVIIKQIMPYFKDENNEIVDIQYTSNKMYVYGKNENLGTSYQLEAPTGYTLSQELASNGKSISITMNKNDGSMPVKDTLFYRTVANQEGALEGGYAYYNDDENKYLEGIVDEDNKKIVFTGEETPDKYDDFYCVSYKNDAFFTPATEDEKQNDADYVGKVVVKYNGIVDYVKGLEKEYKVYYVQGPSQIEQ